MLGALAEREKQVARKCPQIITEIIHQRISHFLFASPPSLFRLLNLRPLFLLVSGIFLETRNRDSPGEKDDEEENNGDELGMTKRWKEIPC